MSDTITNPGFHFDVPERVYHGDPLPTPSLSSSVAKTLQNESPGHAWWAHPRLNRAKALEVEKSTKTQGMGTALHRLILGKGRPLKVLNFDDYKTKAAREARDAAEAEGLTPLLAKDMDKANEVAEAAKRQLAHTDVAPLFADDAGDAEVTGAWQEANGIWCRMRIDWLPKIVMEGGHVTVVDLKTTGDSANPSEWSRKMFDFGGDIQTAFYERGLRKLVPSIKTVDFRFVVIEQNAPFAISLCRVGNQALEEARETVDLAVKMWGSCLERGTALEHWPFYDTESTHVIDPPVWRSQGGELLRMRMQNRMAAWQRPHNPDQSQAA